MSPGSPRSTHVDDSVTPIGQIPSTSNMVSTMFVNPVSSHLRLR